MGFACANAVLAQSLFSNESDLCTKWVLNGVLKVPKKRTELRS